jgi:cytochrome c5
MMKKVAMVACLLTGFGLSAQMMASTLEQRIAPDAKVCIEGDVCEASSGGAAPVADQEEAPPASPEELYQSSCFACHGAGIMGAPKLGDKAEWAPRIAQGMDTLYEHSLQGFNAMPPKGGCAACSDEEVKSVVDYMVEQGK